MGVAHGLLQPNETYSKYAKVFVEQNHAEIEKLALFVRAETGEKLEPCEIGILDYSEEAGETLIEVNVLGLNENSYRKFFAHHIETYEKQFSS